MPVSDNRYAKRGAFSVLELLDSIFRFGAIVCCLFTSAIVLRDAGRKLNAQLAAFCCVGTAAYLLTSIPDLGSVLGTAMLPILLICLFGPTAVWLFCLSMFDDNFKLTRMHYVVVATFFALGIFQYANYTLATGELPLLSPVRIHVVLRELGPFSWFISLMMLVVKLGMAAHMLVAAWHGRCEDLVLKRRRFREIFVVGVGFISIGIVATETWLMKFTPDTAYVLLVGQSASIFLVGIYMLWHITSVDGEWLFGEYEAADPEPQQTRSETEDRHDLETLDALAASGALLGPNMTIAKLADMANMPEHRLRRLVNQHLGYRNFADYLNFHRIEAAKTRLSVVADRHVPVLTVAMDLGYGSLGPFNRAFKERAGMTPTEFRRQALAQC
jgi:AraC-like DNA-binding protein